MTWVGTIDADLKNRSTDRRRVKITIWKKISWFVGIWIASILTLAIFAYGIKLVLK